VVLSVSCNDGAVMVQVADHGPGVPAKDRERIFDRFIRLEGTAAGRPGFGLGLYIVRIISENHGGSVRIEETPGGGATFVVELPRVRPEMESV
jgi:two-component system OmpR family sensor kinase